MVTDPLLCDLLSVSFVLMNPGLDLNTIIFNHKVQVVPKSLKILLQFVDARNTKKNIFNHQCRCAVNQRPVYCTFCFCVSCSFLPVIAESAPLPADPPQPSPTCHPSSSSAALPLVCHWVVWVKRTRPLNLFNFTPKHSSFITYPITVVPRGE